MPAAEIYYRQNRTEFGHQFHWDEVRGCWQTTRGRKVFVFPPREFQNIEPMWIVDVPSTNHRHFLTGEDAEDRSFCIAEVTSRQN